MELTLHGSSDDLFDVLIDGKYAEEFDIPGVGEFLVEDPEGQSLVVRAEFGARGRFTSDWTLSIRNTHRWPENWTIRFGERPDREGDPAIILTVPDGTTVRDLDSND